MVLTVFSSLDHFFSNEIRKAQIKPTQKILGLTGIWTEPSDFAT